MKRKIFILFLTAAFLSGCLAGCGNRNQVVYYENTAQDIVTITFFGNKYEPENVEVIKRILTAFMDENPDIRVSYESLKGNAYYDALKKRMASGKGDDVFMVNHDILLELEKKRAGRGPVRAVRRFLLHWRNIWDERTDI